MAPLNRFLQRQRKRMQLVQRVVLNREDGQHYFCVGFDSEGTAVLEFIEDPEMNGELFRVDFCSLELPTKLSRTENRHMKEGNN